MSSKKEQLIKAATELLSRHGFHPIGFDRILAEAGVARVTLYDHLPGKDDLISAMLEHRYQDIVPVFVRALSRICCTGKVESNFAVA
ncbi:TetR/AcrR family transcriptional regulator [Rhizobium rhizogenes]|uniref:TetR/AcrR family transcriptional regulator n=1 Tax=Rhizobium rhizogenes TaxID=359 RepID=UPI00226E400F|nr:TetR/AcrR family transcriptional regulator [Rhizobium rhizogenes]